MKFWASPRMDRNILSIPGLPHDDRHLLRRALAPEVSVREHHHTGVQRYRSPSWTDESNMTLPTYDETSLKYSGKITNGKITDVKITNGEKRKKAADSLQNVYGSHFARLLRIRRFFTDFANRNLRMSCTGRRIRTPRRTHIFLSLVSLRSVPHLLAVCRSILPRVAWLSDLLSMWEDKAKDCILPGIAFSRCPAQDMESPLVRLTDVEVTNYDAKPIGISWPMHGDTLKFSTKIPLVQIRFQVDVDDRHLVPISLD